MSDERAIETVLYNGLVTTLAEDGMAPPEASALAVRSGRIAAVGDDQEIMAIAGPRARRIDVGGRRVVPGLIDTHIHSVRAGRTWNQEVRWENERNLASALRAIGNAAAVQPDGEWIRVIGGWHPAQFEERRAPTRDDLDQAAPANPTMVQHAYEWAVLNSAAMRVLGVDDDLVAELGEDKWERDDEGALTGKVLGLAILKWLYGQMPLPTFEEQVQGTADLYRHLNRFGITGVIDGGGANTGPDAYGAVYEVWRRRELTARVRLMVHAAERANEREQIENYCRYTPLDLGDGHLRVLGAGEVVLFRVIDHLTAVGDLADEAVHELREALLHLAENRWTVHMHAHQAATLRVLLEAWERVNADVDITDLRWAVVHGEGLTGPDLKRLESLGAGLLTQGLYRFVGDKVIAEMGPDRLRDSPPLRQVSAGKVPLGLGSDGMRAASYNPFVSMAWFTHGRTITGAPTLAPANLLTREEALRGYTSSAAWFSFEERERGRLQPGFLADLAVLDQDYFQIDDDKLEQIESVLTMVDGRIVHVADGAFEPEVDVEDQSANLARSRH